MCIPSQYVKCYGHKQREPDIPLKTIRSGRCLIHSPITRKRFNLYAGPVELCYYICTKKSLLSIY